MPQGVESRLSNTEGLEFTVDTTITDSLLVLTGTPSLSVNGSIQYLDFGDNCIIKGFCLSLPYQFGQGARLNDESMFVQLGWVDSGGTNFGPVNEVGDTGRINIPDPNVWYDTDIFVKQPAAATSKWGFRLDAVQGLVSQIYAPAVLDTDDLAVGFHLKILHTLPLLG